MTATTINTFGSTGIGYEFREGAETMNAGKYRVTDPCYFLGHDDPFWNAFCAFMFPANERTSDSYIIEIAGYKVFTWGTAYGDGCYPTLKNDCEIGESGVDAGMLSLVPVELYDLLKDHLGENDDKNTPVVEMTSSFCPEVDEGDCSFGSYEVLTSERATCCQRCGERREYLNWDGFCDSCQREAEEERREEEDNEDG